MNKEIVMQFVGFTSKALVREYTFWVRETSLEPREFTVTIANEAFSEHRLSFQDAPDVCSLKLRRELINGANLLPESHFHLTNAELDDYRASHTAPRRISFARRTADKS
jgi:cold-inducible RNA-binding protein